MFPIQFMHKNGKCEDFLQYAEKLGFEASYEQEDENGLDCIDNALAWLNRVGNDIRYVMAEFEVIVAIPA